MGDFTKNFSAKEFACKCGCGLRLDHKTADEISRALTVNFKPLFKLPIEQINPGHIEQWRTQRRAAGLRAASINRTVTYLKASLNWAFKAGIIDKNPLARVSPLKERDSKLVIRYLTPEERDRLEAALIDRESRIRANREHANALRGEGKALPLFKDEFVDYLRPAVMLSLLTGIRRGALFALAWGDIDFAARTVTLRGDDAKDGKTHVLPLCDDAIDILPKIPLFYIPTLIR